VPLLEEHHRRVGAGGGGGWSCGGSGRSRSGSSWRGGRSLGGIGSLPPKQRCAREGENGKNYNSVRVPHILLEVIKHSRITKPYGFPMLVMTILVFPEALSTAMATFTTEFDPTRWTDA